MKFLQVRVAVSGGRNVSGDGGKGQSDEDVLLFLLLAFLALDVSVFGASDFGASTLVPSLFTLVGAFSSYSGRGSYRPNHSIERPCFR